MKTRNSHDNNFLYFMSMIFVGQYYLTAFVINRFDLYNLRCQINYVSVSISGFFFSFFCVHQCFSSLTFQSTMS